MNKYEMFTEFTHSDYFYYQFAIIATKLNKNVVTQIWYINIDR